jgi:thiosulfate/3-mercaptopyruvate sulfurtransferase
MKHFIKTFAVIISFLLVAQATIAGEVIVSAKDFTKAIKSDKSIVVIDANTAANYAKSHVMNAVNVPHKELYKEGDIEGLIKSADELAAYFGAKGISNTSKIVIYDDGSNKYASRVYWVLKYLGAENVQLLHKDMDEWRAARLPLTRNKSTVKAATFTPKVNAAIMATADDVKGCSGSCVLVDSREPAEYNGTSEKPESVGHIKGAINVDYQNFVDDKGAFKPADQIKAIAAKNGITADKKVILYCVTSVRAAVTFVALHEILGYTNVKVYDGAYNEWKALGNPMEK